jgi:hypothetical protein
LQLEERLQGSSTFRFAFTEKPGQYGVGLKVVEQYDHSRTFQLEGGSSETSAGPGRPQPLQTLVWYPAPSSGNRTMTFGDYETLIKTEVSCSFRARWMAFFWLMVNPPRLRFCWVEW